jgi:hypothetical protein
MTDRLKNERGFALAMAIFALVLLAAVVAGGYFSASQEFQIGRGMRSLTTSIYSGEAGIYEVLEDWDPGVYFALQPGDTLSFTGGTFEGGGSYAATVVRVGSAADSVKRYFYIEAVGRPPLPSLGERRQAMVVRARYPDLCCDAALKVAEELDIGSGGQERIVGFDTRPTLWPDSVCATIPQEDGPGLMIDPDWYDGISGNLGKISGSPPIVQAPVPENNISFPDYTWDELKALADHTLSGYQQFGGSSMSLDANGECDPSDPANFGAPNLPSHPCFNYFPIVYFPDTLKLTGGGYAQGIFLVQDRLELLGPFDMFGIVLVRDDMYATSAGAVFGSLWVADDAYLAANSKVFLSRCAVERAVRLSRITRPVPVSGRPWVELF